MNSKLLKLNVRALTRSARLLRISVVLTTVESKPASTTRDPVTWGRDPERSRTRPNNPGRLGGAVRPKGDHKRPEQNRLRSTVNRLCPACPVVHAESDGHNTTFVADSSVRQRS